MQTNPKGNYQVLVRYLLSKGKKLDKKIKRLNTTKYYITANLNYLTAIVS